MTLLVISCHSWFSNCKLNQRLKANTSNSDATSTPENNKPLLYRDPTSSSFHPKDSGVPLTSFWLYFVTHLCSSPWVIGWLRGSQTPSVSLAWAGHGKMAALASSLIRQRREVKDQPTNRQISNKRKPCPKSNKSLCQKQILILISKVRLCGSRGKKLEKRPGEYEKTLVLLNLNTSH